MFYVLEVLKYTCTTNGRVTLPSFAILAKNAYARKVQRKLKFY